MQIIDSIIDLAQTMEPGRNDVKPNFVLKCEDGKWIAKVSMRTYYCDATGDSDEEVLQILQKELIRVNQNAFKKASTMLSRWSKFVAKLVLAPQVKETENKKEDK